MTIGKNRIVRDLIIPLLIMVIGGPAAYFIEKLSEPKTGVLLIQSDVDSAKVFMNGEFKGITGPIDTSNHNTYVLKIGTVYPGTYQLKLQKIYLNDLFIKDVVVNPGYLTSTSGWFYSQKTKSNNINHPQASIKSPKLPEQIKDRPVTGETEVTNINKPLTRRLAISLTSEVKLQKVSFFVDGSIMGTPSSYEFSIELSEGIHEITFTYSDAIGNKYIYSVTKNISGNDNLIVVKNDFIPM